MKQKACAVCEKLFTPRRSWVVETSLYCSNRCKMTAYWQRKLTKIAEAEHKRAAKEAKANRRKGERRLKGAA